MPDSSIEIELSGNTDAQTWAKAFVRLIEHTPRLATDEGTMLGWFANAIMAGHDEGVRQERQRGFDERVREIAYQAAGAGAGAVMEKARDVVMPDREVAAGVDRILAEHGVEGYPTW